MKMVILYSQHEAGQQQKAEALAGQLGAYATAVELEDAYGGELAGALRILLGVREFPAVVFVQDHLQGAVLEDAEYMWAVAAEQMDIEEREFRQRATDYLGDRLAAAKEEGRREIRAIVAEAAGLPTLDGEARQKLKSAGILL